jgi:hypothetical protein
MAYSKRVPGYDCMRYDLGENHENCTIGSVFSKVQLGKCVRRGT